MFRKDVLCFLTLTIFLSIPFYYWIATVDNKGWYYFGLMWCPGTAAILTSLFLQKNLEGFGWTKVKPGWLILAYVFPVIELSLVYSFIWGVGLGGFAGFENNFMTKLAAIPMILIILEGTYFAGRSALGEEIGWRGFLTPKLLEQFTPNQVSFIVGFIWAAWHFPIMVTGDYGLETPLWYQIICFTCTIVGANFVYTWLTIKSESLWAGVLLHTTGNLFIFHVFDSLTVDNGNTAYFYSETGLMMALWGLLLIFLFCRFGWDWPNALFAKLRS